MSRMCLFFVVTPNQGFAPPWPYYFAIAAIRLIGSLNCSLINTQTEFNLNGVNICDKEMFCATVGQCTAMLMTEMFCAKVYQQEMFCAKVLC